MIALDVFVIPHLPIHFAFTHGVTQCCCEGSPPLPSKMRRDFVSVAAEEKE
jgi:hypothetical protein